jgi:hypothetical protein
VSPVLSAAKRNRRTAPTKATNIVEASPLKVLMKAAEDQAPRKALYIPITMSPITP